MSMDIGPKLSYHSKYLLTFSVFYLGIGLITVNLPIEQKGFPDALWLTIVTINLCVNILGALNEKYRKYAYAALVITPALRATSFIFSFILLDVSFLVAFSRIFSYSALIANHYYTARRPDYNVFISNVIKDSPYRNELSPAVLRRLTEFTKVYKDIR